ncbi:pseudaminic acid biosynthesis-associated methylase [Candidatus Omnitrophota bacterium]
MAKITKQMEQWSGNFGHKYTDRNTFEVDKLDQVYMKEFGVSATELYLDYVGQMPKDIKVLEVGSNSGNMLGLFRSMGFENVYGIEINRYAIGVCRARMKDVSIIEGSALDIPFKDGYFDLVFTAGVLIHVSPDDIKTVLNEIYRCSGKYIMGCEFYSDSYQELDYRGNKDLLWKTDFNRLYQETFQGLKPLKERRIKYSGTDKEDSMYLLEKKA